MSLGLSGIHHLVQTRCGYRRNGCQDDSHKGREHRFSLPSVNRIRSQGGRFVSHYRNWMSSLRLFGQIAHRRTPSQILLDRLKSNHRLATALDIVSLVVNLCAR